jgi:WD repeat-containing protein 19
MSLVFIDEKSEGYIFNPVNSNLIRIPDLPSTIQGLVWETYEPEKVCLNRIKLICYNLIEI